jgi:lysophospholipase L1-like esterase
MSGARRWLARFALLGIATLVALKLGDLAVGFLLNSQQRHLLRLPVSAHARHVSSEYDVAFTTNSRGLRGPERPLAKPPGTKRVVVVGDSFVAAYEVPDDAPFTVKLEAALNDKSQLPIEVINVGRSGTSTVRECDLYRMIGRRFAPDVVVLAYYVGNDLLEVMDENDAEELQVWHPQGFVRRAAYGLCPNLYLELALLRISAQSRAYWEPRSEATIMASLKSDCESRGVDFSAAKAAYERFPPHVKKNLEQGKLGIPRVFPACYDPQRFRRALDPSDEYFARAWPRTEKHLSLLRKAVAADGAKLVVMIIPDAVQVDPAAQQFVQSLGYEVDPYWLTRSCRTAEAVEKWCSEQNVPVLALLAGFRESTIPLYYPEDGHFKPAGHQLTAELLAEFLQSKPSLGEAK